MTPQKILHILSGDLWAGAEVQAFNLLLELKKSHQVMVCLLNPGILSERLEQHGIEIQVLDESKLSSANILKQLIHLLSEFKPDVIHTHRTKENILGSLANFMSVRARCVRTLHGAPEHNSRLKARVLGWVDAVVGKLLQHHLVLVAPQLEYSLTWPLNTMPRSIIFNAVATQEILQAAKSPAPVVRQQDAINVGYFGRFVALKRIDLILQLALQSGDEIQFHLFGDGPEKAAIERQIKNNNLEHRVHLHGHQDNIYPFIKQMDMLVLLSDHEGLPMILLEALALGKPVLTRDIQPFKSLQLTYCVTLDDAFVKRCLDAIRNKMQAMTIQLPEEFTTSYMTRQLSQQVYMGTA